MNSIRLETISKYFNQGDRVADIGCDHGYLGVYALKRGVSLLQLVDNKKGPLQSAVNNLAKELKKDNNPEIIFTLSSGLNNLDKRINKIAICGMGGHLIIEILEEHIELTKKFDLIILQANSKAKELREFLSINHFEIISEEIVFEKGKFYEIIVSKYIFQAAFLSETDCYFGPILRLKRSHNFIKKYLERLKTLEHLINTYSLSLVKKKTFLKEIYMIRKELNDES